MKLKNVLKVLGVVGLASTPVLAPMLGHEKPKKPTTESAGAITPGPERGGKAEMSARDVRSKLYERDRELQDLKHKLDGAFAAALPLAIERNGPLGKTKPIGVGAQRVREISALTQEVEREVERVKEMVESISSRIPSEGALTNILDKKLDEKVLAALRSLPQPAAVTEESVAATRPRLINQPSLQPSSNEEESTPTLEIIRPKGHKAQLREIEKPAEPKLDTPAVVEPNVVAPEPVPMVRPRKGESGGKPLRSVPESMHPPVPPRHMETAVPHSYGDYPPIFAKRSPERPRLSDEFKRQAERLTTTIYNDILDRHQRMMEGRGRTDEEYKKFREDARIAARELNKLTECTLVYSRDTHRHVFMGATQEINAVDRIVVKAFTGRHMPEDRSSPIVQWYRFTLVDNRGNEIRSFRRPVEGLIDADPLYSPK